MLRMKMLYNVNPQIQIRPMTVIFLSVCWSFLFGLRSFLPQNAFHATKGNDNNNKNTPRGPIIIKPATTRPKTRRRALPKEGIPSVLSLCIVITADTVRNQTITKADQSHTGGKNLSKMAAIQHPHAFASVAAENIYITNALPKNDNILFK